MTDDKALAKARKVGVLIVHGIGEQKRFDTAGALARALATTLRTGKETFSVIDRSAGLSADELSVPSQQPDACPFRIDFFSGGGSQSLHIHEVWWADIGASKGFWTDAKFWFWALGQWGARFVTFTHFDHGPSNTDLLMDLPKFDQLDNNSLKAWIRNAYTRLLLALWGFAAFLTFFSWSAAKWVIKWVSPYLGSPSIIMEYVDRVRVYTQGVGPDGGSLVDMGMPWRATIRRRMVAELVAMAEREYDCWYVLAHSQGSVLAFNAIEEPEWSLPNHLEPRQFDRLLAPLRTNAPYCPANAPAKPDLKRMMPARPTWLADDAGISRAALFRTFRGLVTYGSPLNKFAALWPRIVCINKQHGVFGDAQWVNLWEACDPIGASLNTFSSGEWRNEDPKNIHTRTSSLFLWAHIRYFKAGSAEIEALLKVVHPRDEQMSLREAFGLIPGADGNHWLRRAFALAQSLFFFAGLSILAGVFAYAAKTLLGSLLKTILASVSHIWPFQQLSQWLQDAAAGIATYLSSLIGNNLLSAIAFVWIVGATTVLVCGVVRSVSETRAT